MRFLQSQLEPGPNVRERPDGGPLGASMSPPPNWADEVEEPDPVRLTNSWRERILKLTSNGAAGLKGPTWGLRSQVEVLGLRLWAVGPATLGPALLQSRCAHRPS